MHIPRGVDVAQKIIDRGIEQGRKFLVYFDPDIDGLIAGYFPCVYLAKRGIEYSYYINSNRAHGFKIEDIERLKGYTIIAVDFLMKREEIEKLVNNDVEIVNIDHHDNGYSEMVNIEGKGVIINNQYLFEPEEQRFQSGAGMVFYVLSAIDKSFITEENISLVGITLLSDIRPIESKEARDFLTVTYASKSPMIEYLISITKSQKDYGFGEIRMDMNYIEYTFSPKFNALFRLNMGYEAIDALLKRNGKDIDFDGYRELQNNVITKVIENLKGVEGKDIIVKFVDEEDIDISNIEISNFIGVACSRVLASGKTTFLFVREGGKIKRGSVRGKKDGVDYLSIFRSFGCKCEGHKNAFGVLECDLKTFDLNKLDAVIREEESKIDEYKNRIINISNLNMWSQMNNKAVAMHNVFVRSMFRVYLKYTGKYEKKVYGTKGKAWGYIINGIEVKCFDADLNPDNGYIMPFIDRGYVSYYLRKLNI